ncbi:uncharacterized protein LOC132706511 isoform X2 [Cylas formicarius]|uniref:uncharacterized protein LOC132706511 isoform X2 n=1 Tax=Cylas formicarius TaxID=197179 RepID=UPI0029585E73|nr:uncharacterized protein LOC132706511 isoform X2 [Cylas formicarius]
MEIAEVQKKCDLCYQINLTCSVYLDGRPMEMLETVVSDFFDKDFFRHSEICQTCDDVLRSSFNFKTKYLQNRDESDDSTFQIKPGQAFCRICSTTINHNECKDLLLSDGIGMIEACLPGLKFAQGLFVCADCQSSVQLYQHFLSLCLEAFPRSKKRLGRRFVRRRKKNNTDRQVKSKKMRTRSMKSWTSDDSVSSDCAWPKKCSLNSDTDLTEDEGSRACFQCMYCSFTCLSEWSMLKHVRLHYDSDAELYSCSYCDYSTIRLKQIERHQRKHNTVPNSTEPTEPERIESPQPTHHCPLCPFEFVEIEDYLQHACTNKSNNEGMKKSWRGLDAGGHFGDGMLKILTSIESGSPSAPHTCPACRERCLTEQHFKIHLNYCDKLYRCNLCSYKGVKSHELEIHSWSIHGFVPLVCKYCTYNTGMVENYEAHILFAHKESTISDIFEPEDDPVPGLSTMHLGQPQVVVDLDSLESRGGPGHDAVVVAADGLAPPACETIEIAESESDSEFIETSLKESQRRDAENAVVAPLNATEVRVLNIVATNGGYSGAQVSATRCKDGYFRSSDQLKLKRHPGGHPKRRPVTSVDPKDATGWKDSANRLDVSKKDTSAPPKTKTRNRYRPLMKGLGQKAFRLFTKTVSKQFAELYPGLKSVDMFQLVSKTWRNLGDKERLRFYEEARIEDALLKRERKEAAQTANEGVHS